MEVQASLVAKVLSADNTNKAYVKTEQAVREETVRAAAQDNDISSIENTSVRLTMQT